MTPRAPVNRILRFSSVDGPGNRTVVFMQGCNMNCLYCHNPETRTLCINCGDCVKVCPSGALGYRDTVVYDHSLCTFCDRCIRTCAHDASPRVIYLTPEETFLSVAGQLPYIRGVTVSGGECSLYPEYLTDLFSLCKNAGLETMIDTNGSFDPAENPELLDVTDGVLLDIKAWDPGIHRVVTGTGNTEVIRAMLFFAGSGKLHEVRTVVVPGLTDAGDTIRETSRLLAPFVSSFSIRYRITAFRPDGVREKYRSYKTPEPSYMDHLADIARSEGLTDVVTVY